MKYVIHMAVYHLVNTYCTVIPQNKALPEKVADHQLVKKCPTFYGT
jgi:hypothetical protein